MFLTNAERDALMVLNAIPGLGNRRIIELIDMYGSAQNVFRQDASELQKHHFLTKKALHNLIHFPKEQFLEQERKLLAQYNVSVVTNCDVSYPQALTDISDAPIVLYMKGDLNAVTELSIGIVGSRQSSIYGNATAQRLAQELSDYGIVVVSGLAKGIDAAAHQGVLKAGGITIGVLGCGLSHIYPLENKNLFDEIPQKGLIISEFPMQMPPLPYNFPRRNRIISGLSLGVVVVEAAQKSGALITSDFALEQGREVFVVPGQMNTPSASGSNNLIKQGAKLISCTEDIIEDLSIEIRDCFDKKEQYIYGSDIQTEKTLTELEKVVFDNITNEPVHIDDLIEHYASAKTILLKLEMKNLVKQLPGNFFVRKEPHAKS